MSDRSAIEWTDATVNFWWGCTKVGPGCDHCYAETWARRTGGRHWGVGVPRRKIKSAAALLHRLDNGYSEWQADAACAIGNARAFGLPVPTIGHRRRVFIQSMSDLFDLEVPLDWFHEGWDLIERCDRLELQIVTKRISVVEKRLAAIGRTTWPTHAGLIVTVVNQAEADRDIPRLLDLKARLGIPWVGLSCEPLLGPIDLNGWHSPDCGRPDDVSRAYAVSEARLDWVIVGGESGSNARPMHPAWARSLRDQCAAAAVPFFFKQWGEWADLHSVHGAPLAAFNLDQGVYGEWHGAGDFVRQCACGSGHGTMLRVGKKAAGRLLDGVTHSEFPSAPAAVTRRSGITSGLDVVDRNRAAAGVVPSHGDEP
jgi:protein gp37